MYKPPKPNTEPSKTNIYQTFTFANLLAAQETRFPVALHIVPLVIEMWIPGRIEHVVHAVFISCVARFFRSPECDFPRRAVRPLPNALLLNVIASNPCISIF